MATFKVTVSIILDNAGSREEALNTVVHTFIPKEVPAFGYRVVEVELKGRGLGAGMASEDWVEKPGTEWA